MSVTVEPPSQAPNIPPGFVPGRNGGLLRAPWAKGQAGNPRGSHGAEYDEVRRLARTASVDAINKLILKMDSQDERVATIAIQGVLTWAYGKPRDYDPNEAKKTGLRFDIDALTPEERSVLLAIIRRGAVRQADADATPETVDAESAEAGAVAPQPGAAKRGRK